MPAPSGRQYTLVPKTTYYSVRKFCRGREPHPLFTHELQELSNRQRRLRIAIGPAANRGKARPDKSEGANEH
jgi:hypothetical protein